MSSMRSTTAVARVLAAGSRVSPAAVSTLSGHSLSLSPPAADLVLQRVETSTVSRGFAASTSETEEHSTDGVKAMIRHVLGSQGALNSDELWEHLERKDVKSKTFMKKMLQQMKSSKSISTMSPQKAQDEGYGDVKPAKIQSTGARGKKAKGQKFKMVYTLSG